MKSSEIKYGVLMNRFKINDFVYFYKPVYLVKGKIIDENNLELVIFEDEIGYEYLLSTDIQSLYVEDVKTVHLIISEEELLKKYPNCDIDRAKREYFNDLCDNTYLGTSDISLEKIDIQQVSMVAMQELDLDEVLSNQEKISDLAGDSVSSISNKTELAYNLVINSFNNAISGIIEAKDINVVKNEIEKIISIFENISMTIMEKEYDSEKLERYRLDIYLMMSQFSDLCEENSMKNIIKTVKSIARDDKNKIEELAKIYASYDVKEPIKKEKESLEKIEIKKEDKKNNNLKFEYSAVEMKEYLDERIIGQEDTKKDVIAAIIMNSYINSAKDRNCCLLIGPTGCGKTLITKTIAEYLDKPSVTVDTTQLTIPGYVGRNIEDFLARLIELSKGDIKKAEEGIILFDEIDKKGSEKNSDISGKGVLNTLLTFIDGTTYEVIAGGKKFNFDTSKLTIFATGAFTDVKKGKNNGSYNQTSIGFNKTNNFQKYDEITPMDLVDYGNMPIELIGRFSTICKLEPHTKDSLISILNTPLASPLYIQKKILKKYTFLRRKPLF